VRATLSASGLSRVIVAGDEFSSVRLSRSPEAIAFTSPLNATGLFELEPENGLLLPFEGMGVDAVWQLELPKASNPFDYRTIADVLLTIEYTALQSYDYRQQVLRAQDRSFSGDRAFSVRDEFPDAWYEFNNPESVADEANRMRATLPMQREDFPPHLEELAVQELSLFFLRKDGFTQELRIDSLVYTAPGGEVITAGEVHTTGGIAGTRRPNGAAWEVLVGHDPVGEWSIQLENTELTRTWFKDGSIQDLVLVVTVTGTTPAWP
jgi:Tc toxin complex TcA C-terminal TcB-binding domain